MESRFSTVKTSWFAEYSPGWTWRCWTCSSTFDSVGNLRHDDSSRNSSLTKNHYFFIMAWRLKMKTISNRWYNKLIEWFEMLTNFATKIWRCHKPRISLSPWHLILIRCLPTSTRSRRSFSFLNICKTLLSYIKVRIIFLPTIIFSTFSNLHLCQNYDFCQVELGTSHH